MSFWRPRSVLQLVLVGFFAALAPLCLAILFTVQTLEELASADRAITRQAIELTRLGQEIQGELLELERHARQYLALLDPELALLAASERTDLLQKLGELQERAQVQATPLIPLIASLEQLDPTQPTTFELSAQPDGLAQAVERLNRSFALISEQRRAVLQWLPTQVDRLLDNNAVEGERVISALLTQLSFLAFSTLALLLLFSYLINKPVQQLTEEIHQLGTTGLEHPIRISGPQEVADLGRKLDWLRQRLREGEQQKQQFLRHISHELKTPLASLREGTDLLAEQVTGHLSQQQQEVVEIVRNNAIALQRLIENLVDYNQLPGQEMVYEEIDLATLMQQVISNYLLSIDQKALRLYSSGSIDSWTADRAKLKTVLDNLVSNAVNYTPEGGSIDIVWRRETANLIVEIANSGDPIPPADCERVFEPFFQSTARRTGPIKGSGIGLSVARDCIRLHGGSLEVINHTTYPVCFRLTCPAH